MDVVTLLTLTVNSLHLSRGEYLIYSMKTMQCHVSSTIFFSSRPYLKSQRLKRFTVWPAINKVPFLNIDPQIFWTRNDSKSGLRSISWHESATSGSTSITQILFSSHFIIYASTPIFIASIVNIKAGCFFAEL